MTTTSRPSTEKILDELGLISLWTTGPDSWLVLISRTTRMFAYGSNGIFIALFFSALGFSDFRIGAFMTLTLAGDVVLTIVLTLVADKIGRRNILLFGSVMMILSGLIFIYFENYWILLLASVVGIISATGGDFGPFRAIEESVLSHTTSKSSKTRSDVLSWYVVTSALGSAIGTELSGRMVNWLSSKEGWNDVRAYHTMFWLYVINGTVGAMCIYLMSDKTEVSTKTPNDKALEEGQAEETEGLLGLEADGAAREDISPVDRIPLSNVSASSPPPDSAPKSEKGPPVTGWKSKLAQISRPTRRIMYKLWFLLAVDSLADGMVGYALTTYYLAQKFGLSTGTLGDITSISYFLAAISSIAAGPLANHLGLINTMVFTHIPSSAAVLLFPAPSSLVMTIILFFVRTGLNNMDQAPRAAFIAAVVPTDELTAVNGITSMLRTLASTTGPTITGWLSGGDRFWIAFVAAGSLRLAYDFGLWALFVDMKVNPHGEN
ncbi:uncharacterized protein I303_102249 [Kwoniella dejecticola CBS 10117]|uniref:Major facilitator superfamily (MFS) profile domain-containing protein n=1 Tax=Kwoniella dejecticola CBS 10117 TaxID=1296121 RepID=A0A1A6ABH3_9TREE|nr:uncharacterized protein I303_01612 [Kwoniella dejecticola CBS 10117]OBR87410.1 hypothetical protein I303_01612 [Kwoniella dejecticola CBS 10117]